MKEIKKYLDYKGLLTYDSLLKAYINETIKEMIEAALSEIAFNDRYDDVKVYDSLASFPETGVEDTLYTDKDTGISYVWNEETKEYIPTRTNIDEEEISSLFPENKK